MRFIKIIVMLIIFFLAGCSLYVDGGETDSTPDAAVVMPHTDAAVDATTTLVDARQPDAEVLSACATVCPGQEYTPWTDMAGNCVYVICRPSYAHCECAP